MNTDPFTIAFITAHRLGDALSQTPSIRFLKAAFSDCSISIIARSPEARAVFDGNPDVDAVYEAFHKIPAALRGRTFDLTLAGCGKKSAMRLCSALYGPQLFLSGITNERVPKTAHPRKGKGGNSGLRHMTEHKVDKLRRVLAADVAFEDYSYVLPFTAQDEARVHEVLSNLNAWNRPLISLHMGCRSVRKRYGLRRKELTHAKAWRINHAIEFCRLLQQSHPDIRCLATGTKAEGVFTRQLAEACPNVIDVVDRFSIKETAALMNRLEVCITPDTGLLHVASSTSVKILGLYAVTDPAHTGPHPGRKRHFPLVDDAMDALTGPRVHSEVTRILERPASAPRRPTLQSDLRT